ncbi:hypothetical protein [Fredinandcohnia quinoae]|nr:hypothetical protein [Fredinandcohnia sp. SECRCQ15]
MQVSSGNIIQVQLELTVLFFKQLINQSNVWLNIESLAAVRSYRQTNV